MIQIPAFGEIGYSDIQENKTSRVILIPNTQSARFDDYCALLERAGFVCKERFTADHRSFAAYAKDSWGVFLNYFANTAELQIVVEENSTYFSFSDTEGQVCTTPRVTQVMQVDYGLSYVIRLSDGRLVIIDGGNAFEEDAAALFNRLKADSPVEKPVIAAWIMTHPHSDHMNCFFPFMNRYGKDVTIERFFFNFPEADDLAHYPALDTISARSRLWAGEDINNTQVIRQFLARVEVLGVPVYTPHTGQCYTLGDADLQFLATMDDTIHVSTNINAASLMFMMELGGQKIFFGGDGSFSDSRLPERYVQELKADILQVPHHGFGCGTDEAQIRGYLLMRPRVCLLPASQKEAYTSFTTYREGTNFLMTRMNVEEMIAGEAERTLELPYSPKPGGASQLAQRYHEGRENGGARTWVFNDLNTARREDFVFSVLNGTFYNAQLDVELFFENMQKKIIRVKNTGLRRGVFRLNCLLTPEEDQTQFDAPDFLTSRGIPEHTYFSVRFISNVPVVISHRDHAPAYHSTIV